MADARNGRNNRQLLNFLRARPQRASFQTEIRGEDNDDDETLADHSVLDDGGDEDAPIKSYTQPGPPEDEEEDLMRSAQEEQQKMRGKEAAMKKTAASLIPEKQKERKGAAPPPEQEKSAPQETQAAEIRRRAIEALESKNELEREAEEAEEQVHRARGSKTSFFQLASRFFTDLLGWPESLLWMGVRFFRGMLKGKPSAAESAAVKIPGAEAITGVARDHIERGWIMGCYCLTCLGCLLPIIAIFVVILSFASS